MAAVSRRGFVLALAGLTCTGCAGYQLGSQSLYPPDIHTVYVPIIESDSFRRYLGERLTEAVCKKIELETPYKVVSTPAADSVLTARILSDAKHVIVEDPNDQPRQSEFNLMVQVSWTDRKGELICEPGAVPIPSQVAQFSQSGMLVPEYGQSVATAQMDAVEKLAAQIVALMQSPW
jgi:hypothetical protein